MQRVHFNFLRRINICIRANGIQRTVFIFLFFAFLLLFSSKTTAKY